MVPREALAHAPAAPPAAENRARFAAHIERVAQREAARAALLAQRKQPDAAGGLAPAD
jgi:hypothetical protein